MSGEQDPNLPEKVELTKEEYEGLKARDTEYASLKEQATAMGFETVSEYHDWLADEAIKSGNGKGSQEPQKQPAQSAPTREQGTQPAPLEDKQARLAAAQATLHAMYTDYRVDNSQKPEEERLGYTRQQLDEVIKETPELVRQLMSKNNGNAYAAAASWLSATNVKAKANAQDANRQQAKEASQQAARSFGGGGTPAPIDKNDKAPDVQLREHLAPRAGYYTGE